MKEEEEKEEEKEGEEDSGTNPHGSEIWTITKKQEIRTHAQEMKLLRRVFGSTRFENIKNEVVSN